MFRMSATQGTGHRDQGAIVFTCDEHAGTHKILQMCVLQRDMEGDRGMIERGDEAIISLHEIIKTQHD